MPEEEEHELTLSQTLAIFKDLFSNKLLWTWIITQTAAYSALAITGNVGEVYMTNDLQFPKETLSLIKVILTPVSILISFLCGFYQTDRNYERCFYLNLL